MSYFDNQNPGISTVNELTLAELELVQSLSALGDPGADRVLFWDESANAYAFLTVGSGLTITDTTITATASGVSGTANEIAYFDTTTSIASLAVATYPSLTELSYVKGVTSAIQTQLNGKQASGSYEVTTNKATDFTTINDTLYPTVQAVNTAITSAVVGLLDYRGSYDASTNLFPATGGSGIAGALLKGDFWMCSVSGTLGGVGVTPGDLIIALVDTPGQTAGNWDLIQHNLNDAYVAKSAYDANTILYATTDDTPVALTVGEQTVVGRKTGGAIEALAIDSDLTSVSANDDTIPSAKATKAMGDLKLPLAGGTMSGDITLGENTSIALDPAGSADGKYSGITITATAGYTQSFGDLVYLAVADSRWELADADAVGTAGTVMLAMVVVAGTDGNSCKLLLQGQIRADAKFPALTVGAPVYVGETAGEIQVAIPTGADNVIRVVGFALTADEIYFNPSQDHQITVA